MARPGRARLCLAVLIVGAAVAGRADEPRAPYGEELTVVGTRPRTVAAGDPTAAATVVDARQYAGEVKTVAELVSTAPGVAVQQYGGLGQLATVSIRGSTADQVQVLLDGLPLNTGAGGGVDLSRIPRTWIERVEVVRGAEGALYGAGALGGVLNVITHPPSGTSWSGETTAGSFDTYAASVEGTRGTERWGTLAVASFETTGGRYPYDFDPTPSTPGGTETVYRNHNGAISGGLLAKGWCAAGDGRVDAVLQLSGGERDIPGQAFGLTPRDSQRDGRAGAVVRWATPVRDDLDLAIDGTARLDRLDLTSEAVGGTSRQLDAAGDATARLTWRAGSHAASGAVTAGGERLALEAGGAWSRAHVAMSAADDVALLDDRVHAGAAMRWERIGGFWGFSGKLGARVRVAGPVSFRASVGRTFRAPTFAELYLQQGLLAPNPDLHPEEAWSSDAGVVLQAATGMIAAGAFATLYQDLIVYEPASFQRFKPFNAGKVSARGVELEAASAAVTPARLVASGAYTWLDTEQLRGAPDVVGRELPQRAAHRAYARVSASPDPFEAHLEMHYVGRQYLDPRNLSALPAALLFHAGASARLVRRPAITLSVELKNLLDDRSLTDALGNPLPGRTVLVTLRAAGGKDDST